MYPLSSRIISRSSLIAKITVPAPVFKRYSTQSTLSKTQVQSQQPNEPSELQSEKQGHSIESTPKKSSKRTRNRLKLAADRKGLDLPYFVPPEDAKPSDFTPRPSPIQLYNLTQTLLSRFKNSLQSPQTYAYETLFELKQLHLIGQRIGRIAPLRPPGQAEVFARKRKWVWGNMGTSVVGCLLRLEHRLRYPPVEKQVKGWGKKVLDEEHAERVVTSSELMLLATRICRNGLQWDESIRRRDAYLQDRTKYPVISSISPLHITQVLKTLVVHPELLQEKRIRRNVGEIMKSMERLGVKRSLEVETELCMKMGMYQDAAKKWYQSVSDAVAENIAPWQVEQLRVLADILKIHANRQKTTQEISLVLFFTKILQTLRKKKGVRTNGPSALVIKMNDLLLEKLTSLPRPLPDFEGDEIYRHVYDLVQGVLRTNLAFTTGYYIRGGRKGHGKLVHQQFARVRGTAPREAPGWNSLSTYSLLDIEGYTSLVNYCVKTIHSTKLAQAIVESPAFVEIPDSPKKRELLVSLRFYKEQDRAMLLDDSPEADESYTAFLNNVKIRGKDSHALIKWVTYKAIPEIDLKSPSYSKYPRPFRPPSLYVALVFALARAELIGLAERVFKFARLAARLSRTPELKLEEMRAQYPREEAWELHHYSVVHMLKLYAFNTRPRLRNGGNQEDLAIGWGSQAFQDYYLKSIHPNLKPGSIEANQVKKTLHLPPITRSALVPIVVKYEFETREDLTEEDHDAFSAALKHPIGREAYSMIFGKGSPMLEDSGFKWIGSKDLRRQRQWKEHQVNRI